MRKWLVPLGATVVIVVIALIAMSQLGASGLLSWWPDSWYGRLAFAVVGALIGIGGYTLIERGYGTPKPSPSPGTGAAVTPDADKS